MLAPRNSRIRKPIKQRVCPFGSQISLALVPIRPVLSTKTTSEKSARIMVQGVHRVAFGVPMLESGEIDFYEPVALNLAFIQQFFGDREMLVHGDLGV